jgi:hypothetical protein
MAGIENRSAPCKGNQTSQPKKGGAHCSSIGLACPEERINPSDKLRGPTLTAEELRLELSRMFLGYLRSKDRLK